MKHLCKIYQKIFARFKTQQLLVIDEKNGVHEIEKSNTVKLHYNAF